MSEVPSPVAILGAGFIGAALADALRPAEVVLASRSGRPRAPVDDHVGCLALDVTDPGADLSGLSAARSLVFAYAPGRGGDRRALYVDGTARVLQRLRAPLRRIVWLGSTSALPDLDGWLDESCATWPTSERGRVQRHVEQLVLEHGTRHDVPALVLRLGGLYGPGRELDAVYRRRGDATLPGDGWQPTNLVHRDDAVAAVVAALRAPAQVTGVVHVCDDDHTPRRRMYERIAARIGAPAPQFAEAVAVGAPPVGKRVSNTRLKAWLGVRLRHPTHA